MGCGGSKSPDATDPSASEVDEMVRKGKKGAAPPPPVKHSFEWE